MVKWKYELMTKWLEESDKPEGKGKSWCDGNTKEGVVSLKRLERFQRNMIFKLGLEVDV